MTEAELLSQEKKKKKKKNKRHQLGAAPEPSSPHETTTGVDSEPSIPHETTTGVDSEPSSPHETTTGVDSEPSSPHETTTGVDSVKTHTHKKKKKKKSKRADEDTPAEVPCGVSDRKKKRKHEAVTPVMTEESTDVALPQEGEVRKKKRRRTEEAVSAGENTGRGTCHFPRCKWTVGQSNRSRQEQVREDQKDCRQTSQRGHTACRKHTHAHTHTASHG
ncbi:RNA-binding motif protein, X-linked 2-like [Alosa alosa]|nr:RNA-binding motif protein, X-linked 2-like [Alosa alosa]